MVAEQLQVVGTSLGPVHWAGGLHRLRTHDAELAMQIEIDHLQQVVVGEAPGNILQDDEQQC